MAMNTNNIKDFERIQTSIQKSRAEWENGSIKPNKVDTYAGIWESIRCCGLTSSHSLTRTVLPTPHMIISFRGSQRA